MSLSRKIIIALLALGVVSGLVFAVTRTMRNQPSDDRTEHSDDTPFEVNEEVTTVTVQRSQYSFEMPAFARDSGQRTVDGCIWDTISIGNSDGMRMAGEIGIYPIDCFNIENAFGKKDLGMKGGYYIISFYDRDSGTTTQEIAETKQAFEIIARSFKVKTAAVTPVPKPQPTPTQPVLGKCYIGGCSSHVCSDDQDIVTTCEYRAEYACYKTADTKCERQLNGQCGWTQTAELKSCLLNPPAID